MLPACRSTRPTSAGIVDPFTVTSGKGFHLKDFSPKDTRGLKDKVEAENALAAGVARLAELQEKLYAQDRWGVLLIFQAMDAAGKDSAIEHVMSGVNPQGCQVYSFKAPSAEELDHDFLWRTTRCLPERGRIGIFNRSYYEEVLVVRVHPEILASQRLPAQARDEAHLAASASRTSRLRALPGAQRLRDPQVLPERLEGGAEAALPRPDRPAGQELEVLRSPTPRSARRWKDYMAAYEDAIRHTATQARALDRRPRRPQVVRAPRRRRRHRRRARGPPPRVPGRRRTQEEGTGCRPANADERALANPAPCKQATNCSKQSGSPSGRSVLNEHSQVPALKQSSDARAQRARWRPRR